MWLMKTLLTSGCTNQRGAGHRIYLETVLIPRLRTGLAVLNKMGLTEREDMELRDVYQRGVEFFDKLFDGPVPQANTTTSH